MKKTIVILFCLILGALAGCDYTRENRKEAIEYSRLNRSGCRDGVTSIKTQYTNKSDKAVFKVNCKYSTFYVECRYYPFYGSDCGIQ